MRGLRRRAGRFGKYFAAQRDLFGRKLRSEEVQHNWQLRSTTALGRWSQYRHLRFSIRTATGFEPILKREIALTSSEPDRRIESEHRLSLEGRAPSRPLNFRDMTAHVPPLATAGLSHAGARSSRPSDEFLDRPLRLGRGKIVPGQNRHCRIATNR